VQKIMLAGLAAFAAASVAAAAVAQAQAQPCNTTDRSVLLTLDASGSMNAKLPNGKPISFPSVPYPTVSFGRGSGGARLTKTRPGLWRWAYTTNSSTKS
jgi:hypothetical protein